MRLIPFALVCTAAVLAACASRTPSEPRSSTAPTPTATQTASSRDGSYEGEITGKARPGGKFATLAIGMGMEEVQSAMGRAPDRLHTYESGKRWIPFYFGNDARRMQVLYKGEGCLVFTGGNVWGAAGGDLIGIHHEATNACYQP